MLHQSKDLEISRRRLAGCFLMTVIILLTWSVSPAWAQNEKRIVKVMTRNMDSGTDLLWFFSGIDLAQAVANTYAEVTSNDFSGRADLLADEIAGEQPYLISLQEVTLWQVISTQYPTQTIADQLDLLMAALAAHNQHYKVVASQDLTDLMAPLSADNTLFLRFHDRNVILARSDLPPSELVLSNVNMGTYHATIEPIPQFVETNGWISVDAKIRGKTLRFFGTHLESPVSTSDITQLLQAAELILVMSRCRFPVVLAGDFNSDAEHTGAWPTDQTPTYKWIAKAGYQDVWKAKYPGDPGLTWPLFFEDFLTGQPIVPLERIDLIYTRGMDILAVGQTGTSFPFGSDHVGVVATLQIAK